MQAPVSALLCLLAAAAAAAVAAPPRCRCTPGQPCWDSVPWAQLNESVGGRLERFEDALAPCVDDLDGVECAHALEGSDDEFWLAARPGGYQHTGEFDVWNITTRLAAYAVRAETEEDFVATVRFAADNNLRLVVKATGHDWYGRSAAGGALLLWTHLRKNITWHDAFVPAGSSEPGFPAVTVESGVQFADLYPAAQRTPFPNDPHGRRTIVMGGGCDSVGVGGCWLGGCYNVFTKKFGDGAVNIVEARVVLANGSLVTTSEASHPDLFWTLRGGGGGNTAVVTQFTARTHPAPMYMISSGFYGRASTAAGFRALIKRVLRLLAETNAWPLELQCTSAGPSWNVTEMSASLYCRHYEGDASKIAALYEPALAWCRQPEQQGMGVAECRGVVPSVWNQSQYKEKAKIWDNASFIPSEWVGNEPWISFHADREISTALVGSLSRYIPLRGCVSDAESEAMVDGILRIEAVLGNLSGAGGLRFISNPTGDKSASGMPPDIQARFKRTSLNPVLLDAGAFWLIMVNIPSLPQLPPSSRVLKWLWPRLQQYAISDRDPLWPACESGASGDEADAARCMNGWRSRVPTFRAQLQEVRRLLLETFPNTGSDGMPYSGSYWNEADGADPVWQASHWGVNYPRLLELKRRFDPNGLFYGHHSVGSELWTRDGNCRVDSAWQAPRQTRPDDHHAATAVVVTEDGATCDGKTDDTAALQDAINKGAAMGRAVEVPSGATCLTQPLTLPSHTVLQVDAGAVIKAGSKWSDGRTMLYTTGVRPWDQGTRAVNVTIRGGGTLDGSGKQWWTGSNKTPNRPKLLEMNASFVTLADITLLNAASWHTRLTGEDYKITGVKIRSPDYTVAPNTDGLDIAARRVHIVGADITNGDDSICMKSPAEDVLVENSVVRQGNGLVVGTSDGAWFRNITFRNCTAINTSYGCHIKFKNNQTGSCSNITFRDIRVESPTRYALGIDQNGQSAEWSDERRSAALLGANVTITNVLFSHVQATNAPGGGRFECNPGALACRGIVLDDVDFGTDAPCEIQNVHGGGTMVRPASCVPPK